MERFRDSTRPSHGDVSNVITLGGPNRNSRAAFMCHVYQMQHRRLLAPAAKHVTLWPRRVSANVSRPRDLGRRVVLSQGAPDAVGRGYEVLSTQNSVATLTGDIAAVTQTLRPCQHTGHPPRSFEHAVLLRTRQARAAAEAEQSRIDDDGARFLQDLPSTSFFPRLTRLRSTAGPPNRSLSLRPLLLVACNAHVEQNS